METQQNTDATEGDTAVEIIRDDGKVFSFPASEIAAYLASGRFTRCKKSDEKCTLIAIDGIDKKTAATLAAVGIHSIDDLRARAQSPDGRKELLKLRGITTAALNRWLGA